MNVYTVIGKIVVGAWAFVILAGLYAALQLGRDRLASWWGMRAKPQPTIVEWLQSCGLADRAPEEVRFMPSHRDEGDETAVPEGGVARPAHVDRVTHSATTPLAYLRDDERQLWTTVIKESAR